MELFDASQPWLKALCVFFNLLQSTVLFHKHWVFKRQPATPAPRIPSISSSTASTELNFRRSKMYQQTSVYMCVCVCVCVSLSPTFSSRVRLCESRCSRNNAIYRRRMRSSSILKESKIISKNFFFTFGRHHVIAV